MNEIKSLQIENSNSAIEIYTKRLEEIKKRIIAIAKTGGDTSKLLKEKKRLEQIIRELRDDFEAYTSVITLQVYQASENDLKKKLKDLGINIMITATVQDELRNLFQPFQLSFNYLVNNIEQEIKIYTQRTDFSSPDGVVKGLNALTGSGLTSSQTKFDNAFFKRIEDKLKSKDIFTVPYFDKKGNIVRRVKASTYASMLARTLSAEVYRKAAKDNILKHFAQEGDLVEILGHSIYPDSPCIPYQGQILSLTGKTKGYTTIEEAKGNGLFHPNCIHSFSITQNVLDEYKKSKTNVA